MLSRPLSDDEVARELAAISAQYEAELPELIESLAGLASQAPRDPEAARRAKTAAHRLRGTAGSYGFAAIGEAAGEIEDAIEHDRARLPGLVRALLALSPAHSSSSGSSK